jgi:hypothetical protein
MATVDESRAKLSESNAIHSAIRPLKIYLWLPTTAKRALLQSTESGRKTEPRENRGEKIEEDINT